MFFVLPFLIVGSFIATTTIEEPQESETVEISTVKEYKPSSWKCPDCTPEEQYVLKELQSSTKITDKNALATIMGNIKQESRFIPNICEGGARIPYHDCHRGGYGIIQWTSIGRYNNLGKFAERFNCDPSTYDCQLRYMVNESIFQRQLPYFQGGGQTISYYMAPAYRWLGWGVKGNREVYAFDYLNKMSYS